MHVDVVVRIKLLCKDCTNTGGVPVSSMWGLSLSKKRRRAVLIRHCGWAGMRLSKVRPLRWASIALEPGLKTLKTKGVLSSADVAGVW